MATAVLYYVQNLWPFSAFKFDDLRESDKLVRKLSVPKHTKEFIFAIREPESQAVIYVLCVQNLSERSALDAECLIREVKPDAVVVQVGHGVDDVIHPKEIKLRHDTDEPVPTSFFEVLKRCFIHKINKDEYENVAGSLVMREIFGIGLHGHFEVAKRVAHEVGSSFLLLESPFMKCRGDEDSVNEAESGNLFEALALQRNSLVPQKVVSSVTFSSRRLCLQNDVNMLIGKSLSTYLTQSISCLDGGSGEILPKEDYVAPTFAQPIYSLLLDLHDIFVDIPSIGRALAHAQRMLSDVNKGETVDSKLLSEVYAFQIAVEGLRIALTNAGRLPISQMVSPNSAKSFSELDVEEKSHALVAQALNAQTKKFKSIVAVMDASGLAGLRKYWCTSVPSEIKGFVEQLIMNCEDGEESSNHYDKKRLLTSKPMVAVGAGATAIIGASSLSKAVPASTFMKVVTFKVPASLKLLSTQTQKVVALVLSKSMGPSKVVAPGFKATASAEKIRAVVHSVIASAEKTSLSAMRTAFYEIMRKRRVRPIGFLPLATFGCSIATCTGLLVYGDGIECVAESLPAAPSIANLGRGIQSLHQASQAVRQAESFRIQKSIEALMYRYKNMKAK